MIEIKNLNFYYDGRQVLHDIHIDFKHHPIHLEPKPKGPPILRSVGPLLKVRGILIGAPKQKPTIEDAPTTQEAKVYTLIGPSGSGKSTLLRTLNRMDALYANQRATGEILIDGQNILAKNVDIEMLRAKVGMVFQKPTPFALSIFDNIAFALKLHRKLTRAELHEEVERLLTAVGLFNEVKNNLKRSAFALSGGQQQRLCFARTLATNPKILLLDEPTSSLDPASTARIEELINTLKKDYLIIMVTHNLAQAKRMGDYTLFMKEGRIIEMNETELFFTEPQKPETQKYIEFT